MKKSLIALAALAATGAFAQSSVTLTGQFDPSIVNATINYANNTSVSQNFLRNNSQGTSNLTFRGVEDLGGGLRAIFLYEADFSAAVKADGPAGSTAATANNSLGVLGGEVFAGLQGGFGRIQLGGPNNPSLAVQAGRQPFGTKLGGGFGASYGVAGIGVTGSGRVRDSNSIVYTSPTMAGFTFAIGRAFGTNYDASAAATVGATPNYTGNEVGARTDVSLNYADGPVRVGVSRYMADGTSPAAAFTAGGTPGALAATATIGNQANTQTNIFVQYDIGAHTLYLGAHNETLGSVGTANNSASGYTPIQGSGIVGGTQFSGYNVAGKINLTPSMNLLFNYGKLTDLTNAVALNKSIATIGVKYDLSKRTSMYARYVNEQNDNPATPGAYSAAVPGVFATTAAAGATNVISTLVGMQHNF